MDPLNARPDNLSEMTFERIRDGIVQRRLAPGSRVSEQRIAAQLEVSKTPVREALLRLRHAGLVEPAGRGLRVIMPSGRAIRAAYELRSGLEHTSARLAASRADADSAERVLFLAKESQARAKAGDSDGFRRADHEFHTAVAQASGNALLTAAVDESLTLTSVLRERDVPVAGDSFACATEHVQVAEAISATLATQAADLMQGHVNHVMQIVLAARAAAD